MTQNASRPELNLVVSIKVSRSTPASRPLWRSFKTAIQAAMEPLWRGLHAAYTSL